MDHEVSFTCLYAPYELKKIGAVESHSLSMDFFGGAYTVRPTYVQILFRLIWAPYILHYINQVSSKRTIVRYIYIYIYKPAGQRQQKHCCHSGTIDCKARW